MIHELSFRWNKISFQTKHDSSRRWGVDNIFRWIHSVFARICWRSSLAIYDKDIKYVAWKQCHLAHGGQTFVRSFVASNNIAAQRSLADKSGPVKKTYAYRFVYCLLLDLNRTWINITFRKWCLKSVWNYLTFVCNFFFTYSIVRYCFSAVNA